MRLCEIQSFIGIGYRHICTYYECYIFYDIYEMRKYSNLRFIEIQNIYHKLASNIKDFYLL